MVDRNKFNESLKALREAIEDLSSSELAVYSQQDNPEKWTDAVSDFVANFIRLVKDVMNSDPDIAAIVKETLGVDAFDYWKKFESDIDKIVVKGSDKTELRNWILKVHKDLSKIFDAVDSSGNSNDYVELDKITSEHFGKDPESTLKCIVDELKEPQFN